MTVPIIVNPHSTGYSERLAEWFGKFENHGASVIDITADGAYEGLNGAQRIITYCGDGTLTRLLTELGKRGNGFPELVPLAGGSGNAISREVGYTPKDVLEIEVKRALGEHLEGEELPLLEVDVTAKGEKEQHFATFGSIGIEGKICHRYERWRGIIGGYPGYAASILTTLLNPFSNTALHVYIAENGRTEAYQGGVLAFGTTRFYGHGIIAHPNAQKLRQEGKMSVRFFDTRWGKTPLLALAWPALSKGKYEGELAHDFETKELSFTYDRGLYAQIGGEPIEGVTKLRVKMGPKVRFVTKDHP